MEVLTGCTPLHIYVKAEATRAALRLPDVPTKEEDNLRGHGPQIWFTDGSKLEDGSAVAGIFGPNFQRAVAMGKTATVFQAEVHAIELCSRECLRRNVIRTDICILSDSQAALKALTSYLFLSRLVWECYEILQALSLRNKLVLVWIPGHEGNESVDCLAKRGTVRPFIGPEPFCGLTTALDNIIRQWEERSLGDYWKALKGMRRQGC
ncbi:hypothetical protein EVAR_73901_1 [Eumeta japonica]|uniref:RNase H type-1 domain-containing protein n=1 Tax=Eumeta variegata TaxID=151549 RepID=A0A4C1TRX3_EUMVA|nr:hypothetical protein EVAR_73901_1 [Eumeta japonica]